jgi:hypothetical protein
VTASSALLTLAGKEERRMSEENLSQHPVPATSLYDLLQHLTRMTTSLERVWSEGLETESARSARAEAKQVWQSFNVTFKRWTEYAFSLREQAGLEPVIIEEFPVQDTGLGRLSIDPVTPERRHYQLQIAAMYAFQDLMEILQALDHPNAWELRLPTGSVETWWEAGAFSLIRRRARSLARILKLSDEALQATLRESSAEADVIGSYSQPSLWADPLTSAFDLVNAGNYDSALPQLLAALRATLAQSLSAAANDLPVPLAPSIADIDVLSSVSQHVPLLEAACERLGRGLLLDPGVAVPLAKELLSRIQELAVNPPTAEQLAPLGDRQSQPPDD